MACSHKDVGHDWLRNTRAACLAPKQRMTGRRLVKGKTHQDWKPCTRVARSSTAGSSILVFPVTCILRQGAAQAYPFLQGHTAIPFPPPFRIFYYSATPPPTAPGTVPPARSQGQISIGRTLRVLPRPTFVPGRRHTVQSGT